MSQLLLAFASRSTPTALHSHTLLMWVYLHTLLLFITFMINVGVTLVRCQLIGNQLYCFRHTRVLQIDTIQRRSREKCVGEITSVGYTVSTFPYCTIELFLHGHCTIHMCAWVVYLIKRSDSTTFPRFGFVCSVCSYKSNDATCMSSYVGFLMCV